MAGKFSRKKQEPGASWVLGAVLIVLLLAAITLGALWVLRASRTVGASNAAASQVPAKTDAPQEAAMQQPQAPEYQPEPEALPAEPEPEPEPEASRVTLMALGDNLIHNTVYWSAELPAAAMILRRSTRPSRRSFHSMTLPASIRRRFWSVTGALRELPQFRLSHAGGGRIGQDGLFRRDRCNEPLL